MATLNGQVALVTGAARGTGDECARELGRAGADVAIADVLEGSDTCGGVRALGRRSEAYQVDVSERTACTGS
jgi:meso-butanediol dehydrogenase/(S,S)-butanediol dehydrogenase/diacetyl reductase